MLWVVFLVLVVFCLLFGCGVGVFCVTTMLVLLVVVVGDVGVSWLWGSSKLYGLTLFQRRIKKTELKRS